MNIFLWAIYILAFFNLNEGQFNEYQNLKIFMRFYISFFQSC
jgi:hypothetical protein